MAQSVCELAAHTILFGGMAPDAFATVLDAFGPLPAESQCHLAERLVGAIGVYRLEVRMKGPQPSKEKERLQSIAKAAVQLLQLLGIDEQMLSSELAIGQPYSWAHQWLVTELYKVAKERRPASATLAAAERWTTLALLLSDLNEAAGRCASMAAEQSPRGARRRGRGGPGRKGPEPKTRLLNGLFDSYAALRARYPESGPSQVCDDSLKRFVRAGLVLAESSAPPIFGADGARYELWDKACGPGLSKKGETTDAGIAKAFERWRRQSKAMRTADRSISPRKRSQ